MKIEWQDKPDDANNPATAYLPRNWTLEISGHLGGLKGHLVHGYQTIKSGPFRDDINDAKRDAEAFVPALECFLEAP